MLLGVELRTDRAYYITEEGHPIPKDSILIYLGQDADKYVFKQPVPHPERRVFWKLKSEDLQFIEEC